LQYAREIYKPIILFTLLSLVTVFKTLAQIQPPGTGANLQDPKRDSSQFKTNNADWKEENVRIFYRRQYSNQVFSPDSDLHTFHRRIVSLPLRDLGNSGSPVQNLFFTPEDRTGPTLGYHVYDVYRYNADSLNYYNTNRPYSFFTYQLGAKLEQLANLMHTQNIKPNWNFAIGYRKINSPGFYNIQRTNHDNANLSTHYQSRKLHYELFGGLVYNKEQQDENGGMTSDTFLTDPNYTDRRTIPVNFRNDAFGTGTTTQRSSVTNMLRDYTILVNHAYTWGRIDTLYNEDSTRYSFELTPRFSIAHRFELSDSRHLYKDLRPDSLRYSPFFSYPFAGSGTDSVYSRQDWLKIDNRFTLNGFLGKHENQLLFSAGLGNRFDRFKTNFLVDKSVSNLVSNYFIASINKEALLSGKWFYGADILTYFTGEAAGNTALNAKLGKDIGKSLGSISIGLSQNINNAPYNYTTYINQYDTISKSFEKENITQVYGNWYSQKRHLGFGVKNYLVNNYIYLNEKQLPDQYSGTFNITQAFLRKAFRWKILVLDNELFYQVATAGAPVNIPQLMGRHQLSIETNLFKSVLKIATGVELSYHSAYNAAAYSPFFNRYYYQGGYYLSNKPQAAIFFNFQIKRFRAYIMADQFQQLSYTNTILAPGYAAQNLSIRFGFNWILLN